MPSRRLAAFYFSLVTAAAFGGGCDGEDPLGEICCKSFNPGTDMTSVDWGLEGQANVQFGVTMQAIGDFAGAAGALVLDVGNACQALAVDLGADADAVTAPDPSDRATAWCAEAVAQIEANVTAEGSVEIVAQPPTCSFSASAQASCEAKCTANVDCEAELGDIEARCDPGQLSVRCSGECTGTCEGSANLAVACDGTCHGTCEGTCSGASGEGGACDGRCEGTCRGSCAIAAGASVTCSADCTGGCMGEFTAPKCKTELTPPSAECSGSAECNGSCEASASAHAECKEPAIEIIATGDIDAAVIASLKLHLPKLLLIAEARGELLFRNAEAVFAASSNLGAGVEGTAGLCIIPAVGALGDAIGNLEASISATASVMASLDGD